MLSLSLLLLAALWSWGLLWCKRFCRTRACQREEHRGAEGGAQGEGRGNVKGRGICASATRARAREATSRQPSTQGMVHRELQKGTPELELCRCRRQLPKGLAPLLRLVGVEDLAVAFPWCARGDLWRCVEARSDGEPEEEACLRRGEGGWEPL